MTAQTAIDDSWRVRQESSPSFTLGFRPDVEGLRAFAVLTVLAFHASVPFFTGGFIGVDVFFVISGFLITSLMLAEIADTGRISLREFYARRARRILPSASLVIVAVGVASLVWFTLLRTLDTAQDIVASSLYVVNWQFIHQGTDYLATRSNESPLLHYWSLSVEEQFYVLWPSLLILAVLIARKLSVSWKTSIAVAILVVTGSSFALSAWVTPLSPPTAYMSSFTRAWQFGVGALIAISMPTLRRLLKRGNLTPFLISVGWLGLAALFVATIMFNSRTPYPGTAALVPTLGTAAIIVAGTDPKLHRGVTAGRLLGTSPMRAIGRLSFAWYLWHWPFVVFGESIAGHPLEWPVKTGLVLISAIPAWLTLRVLERPIRFSRSISSRSSAGLAVGATAMILSAVAGLALGSHVLHGLGSATLFANTPTLSSVFAPNSGGMNSGAVSPNPLVAADDRPKPDDCILLTGQVSGPECRFGDRKGPTVVLFGDSHAQQWQPALESLAAKRGWSLVIRTKAGCPAEDIPAAEGSSANFSLPTCAQWRTETIKSIANELHPSLIVVSGFSNYLKQGTDSPAYWSRTLARLQPAHAPILYIRDNPEPNADVAACMSSALDDWKKCSFDRASALRQDSIAGAILSGAKQGVYLADFTNYLCPDVKCPAVRSGILFYRDDSHITATLARVMTPALAKVIDDAGIAPKGTGTQG